EHDVLEHDVARENEILILDQAREPQHHNAGGERQQEEMALPHLAPEDTAGAKGEGEQQEAEGDGGRPGGTVEGGGQALDDAQQHGGDERPRKAPHAAQHADREDAADIVAAHGGLHRLDDDEERAGDGGGGDGEREGDALDADGIGGKQAERQRVLRDGG